MYVIKPRSLDDSYWPDASITRIEVFDYDPQPTRLYDKQGNPIYRVCDPIRLGFKA